MAEEAKWYVVHTYSGYENKVKVDIEKTIENRNLQDQILEVMVPMQTVVEERNGEKKQVQKKMFPAYVLLNMVMNDETWYVVRNTRGVTGFVGRDRNRFLLPQKKLPTWDFWLRQRKYHTVLVTMFWLPRVYGRIHMVSCRKFTRQNIWQ